MRALGNRDVVVSQCSWRPWKIQDLYSQLFPKLVVRAHGKRDFVVWNEQNGRLGKNLRSLFPVPPVLCGEGPWKQ